KPVDKQQMRDHRLKLYELPDYKPRRNRSNNWGYDPEEQRRHTYTGMGFDINAHDQWAIESQGHIQDRTREHLGQADKAISHYRRVLLGALDQQEKGENTLLRPTPEQAARLTGPIAIDGISTNTEPMAYYQDADARRRRGSSWAAGTASGMAAE